VKELDTVIGAIGRGTLRAAGQPGLDSLLEEWGRDVRSKYGDVVLYIGRAHGDARQIVIIALFQDSDAYRRFEQLRPDHWAQIVNEHLDGDMQWDEIEVNQV
jgi:hypothetical protein